MAQIPPAVAPIMTSLVTTSAAGKVELAAGGANEGRLGRGGVGGGRNGSTMVMVGTVRTVTPSAVEGAVEGTAAMPRLEDSEACTAAAVVEGGTAMVAVMITLAADTSMVTRDVPTPAAMATFCCKLEVSS